MNGGVSLAVWMSGATRELNNYRLAADAAEDSPSRFVWHKLLNAANTRVTIDIIAGASAGGLNGTVLAKAIAMQEDLPDIKTLWFDRAVVSAGKLLALNPLGVIAQIIARRKVARLVRPERAREKARVVTAARRS
jgi:hypothetical protein